jgi:hypothetical protein
MVELPMDATVSRVPAEVAACRRAVRLLSFVAFAVTVAAAAAVLAVMAATGVSL